MGILALLGAILVPSLVSANTLTWEDQSNNEDGFVIEALAPAGFLEVGRVAANVTTFTDTRTEGVYRVRAFVTIPVFGDVFSLPSNMAAKLNAPLNLNVK